MAALPVPGERPIPDASDPATFGVHLSYIAAELHSIDKKTDAIAESVASLMRTIPISYASQDSIIKLAERVNALEHINDIGSGNQKTIDDLTVEVRSLHDESQRTKGGQSWLWTAYIISIAIIGLAITIIGLYLKSRA